MAEVVNNENVALEEDLSEQMIIRREKLKALQDEDAGDEEILREIQGQDGNRRR